MVPVLAFVAADVVFNDGKVTKAVGDAVVDVVEFVVDEVIDPVMTTVGNVVEAALDDPIKTIAQVAAIATGNAWALPLIEGADVAIAGGDLSDVLEATAKAYVVQQVGTYVGKAAGAYAGETVGGMEFADDAARIAAQRVAENVVGAAAGSAAVAVVTGQDPVQALVRGGVSAGVPALLGRVSGFNDFAKNNKVAANVISSAVTSALSGQNPTESAVQALIASSGLVQDVIKSFDPNGTKLDRAQTAIVTDILMGTATAAITGGNPSNVVRAAMFKAGSKALGDMMTDTFKSATKATSDAYQKAEDKTVEIEQNEAAQKTLVSDYNILSDQLRIRVDEQNRLIKIANDTKAALDADKTNKAKADAAIAAKKAADDYITALNKDYAEFFRPNLDKYGGQLDKLKQTHATLTGDYEKLIQAFSTKTNTLTEKLDPLFLTTNRAFVEAMSPGFNADEYRKLNGLAADDDAYEHFLAKGQFQNAPVNNKAAETEIVAQRTRLVNTALEAKGVNLATADPAQVSKILDKIDSTYGNNVAALRAATAQDILAGNTAPIAQLVQDQRDGVFRVDVTGQAYGAWKKPPEDKFTLTPGLRYATQDEFNNSTAKLMYGRGGIPVWVADDPATAPQRWDAATGSYVQRLPEVVVTGKRPTEADKLLTYGTDPGSWSSIVNKAVLDGASTLVNWAKSTGNSTLINTAANVIKAGGGFLESINGISVLAGHAPKDTALGKFADALQNIGKAGNTAEYQAAIKNMQSMIGDAKGVGGTLKAIYGAFKSAPLEFLAEYVGVEGIQEVAPLLIGGVAATGAKGATLALKYGEAVAAKMGTAAGMTAAIATDITESAGGSAKSAYDEAYRSAIKAGRSEVEADRIALDIAQRSALVAAATTAVSMGIGGAALEKAILGRSGTGLGDAFQTLGDFAKTGSKITIKEGVTEGGEEAVIQAFLETQLYKLDPTRDAAGNITAAAAFGTIAGGPIAGGAYAASRTGDVVSNALLANPTVANAINTAPNAAVATQELSKLGVADSVTQANLLNTKFDSTYTSSAEAAAALGRRTDFNYSDADVKALTGATSNVDLANAVEQYVDPRVLDIGEVKAAAAAEGYTISDEEAAKLIGQKDEVAGTAEARQQFDPLATTSDEAKQFFAERNYTPTDAEIQQFVASKAEADQTKAVAEYVNPRQVTVEEARKYLTDLGYTPTDAEVRQFVGQVNEAEQAGKIGEYVDPRLVNEQEVREALVAAGFTDATDDQVRQLTGQYEEAKLAGLTKEKLPGFIYEALKGQIASTKESLGTQISDVQTNILSRVAEYEQAGIARDEALGRAVDDVATQLGTTREDILTKIGQTEQRLGTQIGDLQTTVGRKAAPATQQDLDSIINLLQTQGAYDPNLDYNGDKVIDQKDKVAIETVLRSQQPDYKPDPNQPFRFDPAAGTKWAPTGVFGEISNLERRTIEEAERTRQAQAQAALKTQRLGNLNTMTQMLMQSPDVAGQQVTVKAADPAKIGYIYDWSSIFANPSQQQMFVTPYAQGGAVRGELDDVNDELLKILRG